MLTLIREGHYKLIETKHQTKILTLDHDVIAWPETKEFGELLVATHRTHRTDCVLGLGHYNLYDVVDEPGIADTMHLELEVGKNCWQGYLLLNGLPDKQKLRVRVIPTHEVITGNPRFKSRMPLKVATAGLQ